MKKKMVTICLAASLAVMAIGGATLAYLTDTDSAKNVMVVGNVSIVQNEQQRPLDENNKPTDGALVDFTDNKKILPAVYPNGELSWDGSVTLKNGKTQTIWDESVNNEIDKIVTVTNDGTEAAYIRTIFLYEDDAEGSKTAKIHGAWSDSDGQYREWIKDGEDWLTVTIDGTLYTVCACTYDTALAAGATSDPSLVQFFLDGSADESWYKGIGNTYDILALSQAVQAEGFDDAETALNAAFGEITADNVLAWFADVE